MIIYSLSLSSFLSLSVRKPLNSFLLPPNITSPHTSILLPWVFDFNDMSICLGLFYATRSGNHVYHCRKFIEKWLDIWIFSLSLQKIEKIKQAEIRNKSIFKKPKRFLKDHLCFYSSIHIFMSAAFWPHCFDSSFMDFFDYILQWPYFLLKGWEEKKKKCLRKLFSFFYLLCQVACWKIRYMPEASYNVKWLSGLVCVWERERGD